MWRPRSLIEICRVIIHITSSIAYVQYTQLIALCHSQNSHQGLYTLHHQLHTFGTPNSSHYIILKTHIRVDTHYTINCIHSVYPTYCITSSPKLTSGSIHITITNCICSVYPTHCIMSSPKTHIRVSGMLELLLGSKGLEFLVDHPGERRGRGRSHLSPGANPFLSALITCIASFLYCANIQYCVHVPYSQLYC